jgi:hypothetical protein
MKLSPILHAYLTGIALVCSGCADTPSTSGRQTLPPSASSDAHNDDDHGHDHPGEGPHHGQLIELGGEEYHAEMLHDDQAGTITIYVLDRAAKQTVPIKAREITINMTIDGQPRQFKLAAAPDEGDPEGTSSRFVLESAELAAHLDEDGSAPQLVLTIKGKSYRGKITHSHDH